MNVAELLVVVVVYLCLQPAECVAVDEAARRAACNESSPSYGACLNNLCSRGQRVKRLRGGLDATNHQNSTVSEAFDSIYSKQTWGNVGGGSGDGSKDACGVTAREVLRQIMFKYHSTSILDAPCGGVHSSWMRSTILRIRSEIPCFQYHGVDVVDSVIVKNKAAFALEDWAQFQLADISSGKTRLPLGFDLILSRDALQHLSYPAIAGVLRAYCATNSRYLLVGSYLGSDSNRLINVGETFSINVLLPPFSFPQPIEVFNENVCYTETTPPVAQPLKSLLLYNLPHLCTQPEFKAYMELAA